MPKAKNETTTSPPLLSGAAALALMDAAENPDAELVRLYGEFHRNHTEYVIESKKSSDSTTQEEDRLYEAYWQAVEAMYEISATSPAGLAAKASVIKEYTLESDTMDTMAESLVDDCIALGASPQPHPDAMLISLCDQFIDLEWQMRALIGSSMPKQEFNAAHDPLEKQQGAIGKQIISLRATTSDGAVARAKAAVAWAPDLMSDKYNSEGLHSDILRSLFRDLGIAIPPCGTASVAHPQRDALMGGAA